MEGLGNENSLETPESVTKEKKEKKLKEEGHEEKQQEEDICIVFVSFLRKEICEILCRET